MGGREAGIGGVGRRRRGKKGRGMKANGARSDSNLSDPHPCKSRGAFMWVIR